MKLWVELFGSTGLNGCKILLEALRNIDIDQSGDCVQIILRILSIILKGVQDNLEIANLCLFFGLFELFVNLIEVLVDVSPEPCQIILETSTSILLIISNEKRVANEELARKIGRCQACIFAFIFRRIFLHRILYSTSKFVQSTFSLDSDCLLPLHCSSLLSIGKDGSGLLSSFLNLTIVSLDIFRISLDCFVSQEKLVTYSLIQCLQTIILNANDWDCQSLLWSQALILYSQLVIITARVPPQSLVDNTWILRR
jgi:hypothetical protein